MKNKELVEILTAFRRVTMRWKRLASTFLGFIQIACIIILLRIFR